MRFALVDGRKVEASPGMAGECPCCGTPTVAKCGPFTLWHWAHKSRKDCCSWWEGETEWHRDWKDHFPKEWQEITLYDPETGEKHIADVKTANSMVIELQHSTIKPEEVRSREAFYKKMMWIVDLRRSEMEYSRFRVSLDLAVFERSTSTFRIPWYGRSKLFERWSRSQVPVLFDFGDGHLFLLKGFEKGDPIEGTMDRWVLKVISKQALIEKNGGRVTAAASQASVQAGLSLTNTR